MIGHETCRRELVRTQTQVFTAANILDGWKERFLNDPCTVLCTPPCLEQSPICDGGDALQDPKCLHHVCALCRQLGGLAKHLMRSWTKMK